MKLSAISTILLPYAFSFVVHIFLIAGILGLSMKAKPKPPQLFQETTYLISPLQPEHKGTSSINTPSNISSTSSSTTTAEPSPVTPTQQPNKQKVIQKPTQKIKHESPTPSPPAGPNQTPNKKQPSSIQKQKIKQLLDLADQLEQHAATSEKQLKKIEWSHPQVEVLSTSNTVAQQETAFCQLLQQYITLPLHGSVRMKFVFEQGEIKECIILTPISELDKQSILTQIYKIPFQHFFNTYNASKNIVFHIKLRSDEP